MCGWADGWDSGLADGSGWANGCVVELMDGWLG